MTNDVYKSEYHKADEARLDVLVNALCNRYEELTGKKPTDRLREDIYQALRFL